ncbi:primosomal protein N' [bacterium]
MDTAIGIIFPKPIDKIFNYFIAQDKAVNIKQGQRVLVPFGPKEQIGLFFKAVNNHNNASLKQVIKVLDKESMFNDELWTLAKKISEYYACSLGEALWAIIPKKWTVKNSVVNKPSTIETLKPFYTPTMDQQNALKKIINGVKNNQQKNYLLHGVAGSGKTEVYLHTARQVLKQNKQVIYLIPEISLTPQIQEVFKERFGSLITIWNSRMTDREKFRTWQRIKSGEVKIVVGPRSAVFAPFDNLGAIVIDEEQEDSYKQDMKPVYDARKVAEWRALYHNAVLIVGSATPRVETFYRMKKGFFEHLLLPRKISEINQSNEKKLKIRLIDMKKEIQRRNYSMFSDILKQEIEQKLIKKEQTILFLNRRGDSTYVFCRKCGFVMRCPNCDLSLVYHNDKEKLLCHYCGYSRDNQAVCPECSSTYIRYFGGGIQKVERGVRKLFPNARIARLDQDTSRAKGTVEQVYKDVKNREIDILLGTQIVAKGFDFPYVTLVGVISADTALNLPDFRAGERTFSLLMQVAGRGGRTGRDTSIVLQTYYPEHYAVKKAAAFDYNGFYNEEIKWRQELGYPPFKKLNNITIRGKSNKNTESCAFKIVSKIEQVLGKNNFYEIIGPFQSAIPRKYKNYRWQILVKEEINDFSKKNLNTEWLNAVKNINLPSNIYLSIDIDPVDML